MKKQSLLSRFYHFIWPIQRHEYKKFFPMMFIFFMITFNYNILRAMKDTIIITAPKSGAEVIPFIKVWAMLPTAIFFTVLLTKLSSKIGREKLFYVMVSIFLLFYALFIFVLFPAKDILHPHAFADKIQSFLPDGLSGLIALFRNWTFTSFYVMCELWGAMILSVLFWGFANEISTIDEAKRYYLLFGVGANISGIFSGKFVVSISQMKYFPSIPYGTTAWEQSLLFLNVVIIAVGILLMITYYKFNRSSVGQSNRATQPIIKPKKAKLSMKKNFAYLAKSKYLLYIAAIVFSYNIALNLVEIVWKNQVKTLYPNPAEYNAFMGNVMIVTGIVAAIVALFISGGLLRKFSWMFNAMITPIIVFITGIGFFAFLLFHQQTSMIAAVFKTSPLILTVLFGAMQNCMSRAAKYTIFDATKEIAFIPLDNDTKLKGKAAIDGVGAKLGKSGGSVIYQGLLLVFSSLAASAPFIGIIFLIISAIWMGSVVSLGKQFNELAGEKPSDSLNNETTVS